ncbi:hypothetical protein G6355_12095 [Vibrio cholerae]|uniref:hypothetical protein n=1 Tax=Vibrio cholerae TaxID=666 RepID=UPI000E64D1BE|nr:hypothetical protein [Vibrio cholerae]
MRLVTYEQRLAQIMTVDDLDRQINNSIKYVKRIEAKIKKCDTIDCDESLKKMLIEAKSVVRKLKFNAFSIEQKLLYGNNVDANISGLR